MNMTVTANLSVSDIENMIKKAAEEQMPSHRATKVTFKVTNGYDDRYGGSSPALTGVDVTMVPKEDGGFQR